MKQPVTKAPPLDVDAWYTDSETTQRYRLLEVGDDTVMITDEWGNRRAVNRALWERDMQKEGGES